MQPINVFVIIIFLSEKLKSKEKVIFGETNTTKIVFYKTFVAIKIAVELNTRAYLHFGSSTKGGMKLVKYEQTLNIWSVTGVTDKGITPPSI